MQSISKAFAYGAAIDLHGVDYVDPSSTRSRRGRSSITLSLDQRTPSRGPLVNIGAIHHAMLGATQGERTQRLRAVLEGAAGRPLDLHTETRDTEMTMADRNLALAYMLRAAGSMTGRTPPRWSRGHIEGCARVRPPSPISPRDGRDPRLPGGTNPLTGQEVFSRVAARQVLSVMLTCGMYDNAGDWVSEVGLPAKSGVGGGIIAALPSPSGVASYAPQLDLRQLRARHAVLRAPQRRLRPAHAQRHPAAGPRGARDGTDESARVV